MGTAWRRRSSAAAEGSLPEAGGSLYPALQRLEQERLIEGVWEPHPPQGRRRRGVYKLTAAGRSAAHQTAGRWRQFAERILQVIGHAGAPEEAPAQRGAVRTTQ